MESLKKGELDEAVFTIEVLNAEHRVHFLDWIKVAKQRLIFEEGIDILKLHAEYLVAQGLKELQKIDHN